MGPGRGVPESCCSLLQGEFEVSGRGGEGWGKGDGRAKGVRANVTWPLSPASGAPSLENQTNTYTEGVCTLWYHSEHSKQRQKKWFQMKKEKANCQFGLHFLPSLFRLRAKLFVCLCLSKGLKLSLCLLSHVTTRLRMCTCVCRLPSPTEVTKPCQTAAPRAHLQPRCYHRNTGRDNSRPLRDGTAAWSCLSLLLTNSHTHTHPCGLAVSSTLIGWRATRWRTPLWSGAPIGTARKEKRKKEKQ